MSDLEKYILENRDELDRMEAVPEEAMWRKIKDKPAPQPTPPAKNGFNWKLLAVAALLLSVVGWGLWCLREKEAGAVPVQRMGMPKKTVPIAKREKRETKPDQLFAEQKEPTPALADAGIAPAKKKRNRPIYPSQKKEPIVPIAPAPKTSEAERRMQQLVAEKQQEIGLDSLDRATYADLLRELDEVEISVQEARRDLSDMPQRERLMETLLRYYELKIRILEQINYEINKQKYHEELEKRI